MSRAVVLFATGLAGVLLTGPSLVAQQPQGDPVKGKTIYTEQRCSVCHRLEAAGGRLGPELTTVGDKRDAEWLTSYLPNPKAVDPTNKMPGVKVTGQDLDDLVAYLVSLKAGTR